MLREFGLTAFLVAMGYLALIGLLTEEKHRSRDLEIELRECEERCFEITNLDKHSS